MNKFLSVINFSTFIDGAMERRHMGEGDEYESDNVHVHDMVYWFFFWHGYESTCTLQLKDPGKVEVWRYCMGGKIEVGIHIYCNINFS